MGKLSSPADTNLKHRQQLGNCYMRDTFTNQEMAKMNDVHNEGLCLGGLVTPVSSKSAQKYDNYNENAS